MRPIGLGPLLESELESYLSMTLITWMVCFHLDSPQVAPLVRVALVEVVLMQVVLVEVVLVEVVLVEVVLVEVPNLHLHH